MEGLEPSTFPLGLYMQAAVYEVADRMPAGDWSANLSAVLHLEAPRPASQARFGGRLNPPVRDPLRPLDRPPIAPNR